MGSSWASPADGSMVTVVLALAHPPYPRRHFRVLHARVVRPATAQHREVGATEQATPLPHHLRCRSSCCSPRECAFVREIARAHPRVSILVVGAGHEGRRRCSAKLQGRVEVL